MENSKYLQPRQYEMMTILLPDQGEEETSAMISAVQGYITEQGGSIDATYADSPWGRRRLAYTIRHEGVDYRDGHYVLLYFTALPTAIAEIEREMRLDVKVIRYLLLNYDPEMGEKFDDSEIEEMPDPEAAAENMEPEDGAESDAEGSVTSEDGDTSVATESENAE